MTTSYGTHISKKDKEWLETMSKEQLFINYRAFMEENDRLKKKLGVDVLKEIKSSDDKIELVRNHINEGIQRIDAFWHISHDLVTEGMKENDTIKIDIGTKDKQRIEYHKGILLDIKTIIDDD